jgi:hypothetical protein
MVRKIIKKITAVTSYLLLFIILLPGIMWGLIQIPAVQDIIVSKVLTWLSKEIGTDLKYKSVYIPSLNRIIFKELYVADQKGDTLLYAQKTSAVLPVILSLLFDDSKEKILLRKLELEKAKINFIIDSTSTLNFQFIIDYLNTGTPSKGPPVTQKIKKIIVTDSRFVLRNETSEKDTLGIDFGNMRLGNFNLKVTDLTILEDTVNLEIEPLSFVEHSGFNIKEMFAHLELCNSYMNFSNVEINTPYSSFDADHLNLSFESFNDFSSPELYSRVQFDLLFNTSELNFYDIGFFTDFFLNYNQKATFSGKFSGPLANFKGKDFRLDWGNSSFLTGDFSISDLPDVAKTFLIFELRKLESNLSDITSINLPGNNKISLPSSFENLEQIGYEGNFTGFFNDFVSYGRLTTNLGVISTDLMISPDSTQQIYFSGKVSTRELNIGKLLNSEDFVEDISMSASVTGSYSSKNPLHADIAGDIKKLTIKKYPYQNITVNGSFSDKIFNGKLEVADPNLSLEFEGLVDMASNPKQYDFVANVIDANLYALNLTKDDSLYHASFLVNAKAKAENMDELNGELHLLNSLFTKRGKQIQIFDLNIFALNSENRNELSIRSEIIDADITGKYKISQLKQVFVNFLRAYLPALTPKIAQADEEIDGDSRIDFNIRFKRTQSIFDFFLPDYLLDENSQVKGTFTSSGNNYLDMIFTSPEVKIGSNILTGMILNINCIDSLLFTDLSTQSLSINEQLELDNFTFKTSSNRDKIKFGVNWLNWDSAQYKGSIAGDATFKGSWPVNSTSLHIAPSSIIISDSLWNINDFNMVFDSSGIFINKMNLYHKNQSIIANGKLSDIPGDSMYFSFENFDLANANFFTKAASIELAGKLNGTGNMTGLKKQPLFFSSLNISELSFNQQVFGDCSINSLWDNDNQSLNIFAEAKRGKLTTLRFSGDYFPTKNGMMDFEIKLDKLKTDLVNPFMAGIFSDIRGLISGDLYLTGITGKPSLSGKLKLQKNSFTVDYLKTRYNFTTDIDIVNNNFILNDVKLYDTEGNSGIMNGMVKTDYLKDIFLNLSIRIANLQCVNLKETENSMFFGTAYATGDIKIKGSPSTLRFDIDAKTDKNTKIMIPLTQNLEVSEYNYISFVRYSETDKSEEKDKVEQQVNLSGMQMDFNLDVTPDAEVQIIFDPTIGDIIKARGTGDMKLSINTLGTFEMVGEYVIEKGDYLFTVQNLINKHLEIEQGSTMRWTGDPFNAMVNITAIYQRRVPLLDLLGEEYTDMVTVNCQAFLTGMLMSPEIKLDIDLPYSDEDLRNKVKSKISEEEKSKQFLALLVMNRFLPPVNNQATGTGNEGLTVAASNASEMLSNQLNNWLSQVSNDFDVGLAYRPGEQKTSDEVEFALSTQLLNDKLSINGSVDMKTNAVAKSSDKFAGDFDIDYKINKKGTVRARAFNRSNDDDITNQSPYTQGVGVFYKEEFNTFPELLGRYRDAITGKRKKMKIDETKAETK